VAIENLYKSKLEIKKRGYSDFIATFRELFIVFMGNVIFRRPEH
jgi:hypothetical protein